MIDEHIALLELLAGGSEILREKPARWHFGDHKCDMEYHAIELRSMNTTVYWTKDSW
jgi:hypothetical protein